tara:strand:- start:613 stop:1929 length:1317 start_codon:yes stop_codon:yes gene_type:complete
MFTATDPAMHARAVPRLELTLRVLAAGIVATTIIAALLFRTYDFEVPSRPLEGMRQMGIVFLLFEAAVILFAMGRGMEIGRIFSAQPLFVRILVAIFLGGFLWGGIVNSPSPSWATTMSLAAPFHVLFAFAVAHSLDRVDEGALDRFGQIVAIGMALFTAILAIAFIDPPDGVDPDAIHWYLAVPGFISHRLFGAFTGALATFFVARYLLRQGEEGAQWWIPLAIVLLLGLTFWTGTRAALVGMAVAMAIVWWLGLPRPTIRSCLVLLACAGIAFAFSQALIPYDSVHFRIFNSGDVLSADAVSGGRLVYWAYVVEAIAAHPWIGAGSSAAIWILPDEAQQHVQPHNVVLQFLVSWGIVAGLAALAILAVFIHAIHKIAARSLLALPFLAALDCLLVISMVDGMFHFARHFMLMMLCAGVIMAIGRQASEVDMGGNSA